MVLTRTGRRNSGEDESEGEYVKDRLTREVSVDYIELFSGADRDGFLFLLSLSCDLDRPSDLSVLPNLGMDTVDLFDLTAKLLGGLPDLVDDLILDLSPE